MPMLEVQETLWQDADGNPVPYGDERGVSVLFGAGSLISAEDAHKYGVQGQTAKVTESQMQSITLTAAEYHGLRDQNAALKQRIAELHAEMQAELHAEAKAIKAAPENKAVKSAPENK